MSQLPTNPILPLRHGDMLTGVYQQDQSSKPPQNRLAAAQFVAGFRDPKDIDPAYPAKCLE